MEGGKIKVHYFGLYGKGEPIRMLLLKAGVEFEDHRMTYDEFKAMKETGALEFGQLPMVELADGTKLT